MPSEPFLGEIYMVGFTFAHRGYAFCQGQILSIAQNTALFSLLGTTYGGNGQTTFALPDLRGRAPVGVGQGPGLSSMSLGEQGGVETVTLLTTQLPAHNHILNAVSTAGDSSNPQNAVLANSGALDKEYKTSPASGSFVQMHASAIGNTGQGQPHNNLSPYLGINFVIALEGIFPSRN